MKRMAATAGLPGKKTNHSARKVCLSNKTKYTRNSNYSINWIQKSAKSQQLYKGLTRITKGPEYMVRLRPDHFFGMTLHIHRGGKKQHDCI